MAVILEFDRKEKQANLLQQVIVKPILEQLNEECVAMIDRILIDFEREGKFDLEAIEFYIRDEVHRYGAMILEKILKFEEGAAVNSECECSGTFYNHKKREKTVVTVLGDVRLERDIQQCNKCGKWRALQDEVLDIKRSGYSPGVRKLLSKAGADLCFDEASEHLHEFAGLRVTDKEIERITEGIGQEISNEDDEAARVQMSGDPPMSAEMPAKLYIACDGTGVPVLKKETEGRQGKGESGEAKTREAKLGCVFTQTACTSEGEPIRDAGSTSYVGRIETAEQFGNRIYAEAQRRGLENAGQVIFLGDGAPWIWNLAEQHFPKATQILDFYHAREHLEALSRLLHPEDQSAREMFSSSLVGKLRQGLVLDIIAELKNLELSGKKRKERDREVEYFEKNQSRMRYNEFREAGLFIGSGAIEAGCKSVIAHRLKQSGMRWSVRGANTIIALRCRIKSARFEDYWEQRLAA